MKKRTEKGSSEFGLRVFPSWMLVEVCNSNRTFSVGQYLGPQPFCPFHIQFGKSRFSCIKESIVGCLMVPSLSSYSGTLQPAFSNHFVVIWPKKKCSKNRRKRTFVSSSSQHRTFSLCYFNAYFVNQQQANTGLKCFYIVPFISYKSI